MTCVDEQQQEFWQVSNRLGLAAQEYERASNAYQQFLARHRGMTFHVFRADDVDAALREDVQQWNL